MRKRCTRSPESSQWGTPHSVYSCVSFTITSRAHTPKSHLHEAFPNHIILKSLIWTALALIFVFVFFLDSIYLTQRGREHKQGEWQQREGEKQASPGAGSPMQCGAWSQHPGILTRAEGRRLTHRGTLAVALIIRKSYNSVFVI